MISLWGRPERPGTGIHRFKASDGVELAFERVEKGSPEVLLVHGFASSLALNWKSTGWLELLGKAAVSVTALDLRGHGQSGKPRTPDAYKLARFASDLDELMAHLRLKAPLVIGYSMGARIVLRLLAGRPGVFARAVLGGIGDTVLDQEPAQIARIVSALETRDPGAVTDPMAKRFRSFAERYKNDLTALAQCYREVWEPMSDEALAGIRSPILVATGASDDQIGSAERLVARIPGAVSLSIPGRDHMTVIADPRFKQGVLEFLGLPA